ncbi:LysR family transcriptional regulator [Methylobacterium brachiatum]|uniref:LysR family transcriptional regulator n=1 Tax=Methylobacterium brachiatum TaxID=269660 RepID=UPI002449C62B|nr:LysR family transcriptional regulator [Methylobacterium brachiatum]MDH2313561.1 LysR family transcriptional regulator [Methylobacterium brachiatum]
MDRLEAMRVFVTALDEGSLACAGRRLSRSPAAMTRAIAALERHVGARLLHRTTRVLQLTEAGEQYAAVCRRVLTDLDEADLALAGNRAAPRGVLTVTAPVMFGTRVLRPVVGEFLRAYPAMQVRYLLLNRVTNLVDEGIDVALRIAPLQESSLIAVRIGEVRRVLCASPRYLADRPPINTLADLARHDCIGIEPTSPTDIWSFPPARGSRIARTVRVKPRLMVNTDDAAVGAAIDGEGIVRIFSYKIQDEVRDGRLAVLLPADEPPPVPIHLVVSPDRLALAKVRAFMDFAAGRLRTHLDRMVPQVQTSDAA